MLSSDLAHCRTKERKPLDTNACGAVPSGKKWQLGQLYQCKAHQQVNCKKCFDWVKNIAAQEKKKDTGKVEDVDLLLRLLRSMEVEFPPAYRPSTQILERMLTKALDFAQDISRDLKDLPLDPRKLSAWKVHFLCQHRCLMS